MNRVGTRRTVLEKCSLSGLVFRHCPCLIDPEEIDRAFQVVATSFCLV